MRVEGLGFMVQGVRFRVSGWGLEVQGSGFRVQGSGFRVPGLGLRVEGPESRVQGSGYGENLPELEPFEEPRFRRLKGGYHCSATAEGRIYIYIIY